MNEKTDAIFIFFVSLIDFLRIWNQQDVENDGFFFLFSETKTNDDDAKLITKSKTAESCLNLSQKI